MVDWEPLPSYVKNPYQNEVYHLDLSKLASMAGWDGSNPYSIDAYNRLRDLIEQEKQRIIRGRPFTIREENMGGRMYGVIEIDNSALAEKWEREIGWLYKL